MSSIDRKKLYLHKSTFFNLQFCHLLRSNWTRGVVICRDSAVSNCNERASQDLVSPS